MSNEHEKLQIVLVEDHAVFRDALATIIEASGLFTISGQADDITSALRVLRNANAQIAIVDVALKGESGFLLIKQLKAEFQQLKILVLSGSDETEDIHQSIAVGALGYLNKCAPPELLLRALTQIAEGKLYFSEEAMSTVIARVVSGKRGVINATEMLSPRELQVFRLFGQGKSTSDVALALGLSRKTVEAFRARIKKKLGIRHALGFIRAAVDSWRNESRGAQSDQELLSPDPI